MTLAYTILAAVARSREAGEPVAVIEVRPETWADLRVEHPLFGSLLRVEGDGWGFLGETPIAVRLNGVEERWRLATFHEVRARARARKAGHE